MGKSRSERSLYRKVGAILCGAIVVVVLPTLFYNVCGLAGMRDCADGPRWVLIANVTGLLLVVGSGAYLSYRLWRPRAEK